MGLVYEMFLTVFTFLFISTIEVQGQENSYFHSVILDKERFFKVSWKFDNETITFEVQAKVKGWVGLGFSLNGAMAGSDMLIAWVDNYGIPRISDRMGIDNGFPPVDSHQDYLLVKGKKFNDQLMFIFTRKRNTCDDEDFELTNDATRLIYAFDDIVPKSQNRITQHAFDHRGAKTVYLFDPPSVERTMPEDVVTVEFLVKNVSVADSYRTFYWCEVVEMPDLKVPHYLIRHEPLVQNGHEKFVHHITLSHCGDHMKRFVGDSGACFDENESNFSKSIMECTLNLVFVWVKGGDAYSYPDDTGVLMFGEKTSRYYRLEVHYDNAALQKNLLDNSGVRLFLTPTMPKHQANKVYVAAPIGPIFQMLPPGQDSFTTYAYCTADCTKEIPQDGWTVFSALVHAHQTGIKGRLRHIRNGVMLEDIVSDEHYDFTYQNTRMLKKNVKIMPGDELVVECTYNTVSRKEITFGGFSTIKEMCLIFFDVYPLSGVFTCYSTPAPSTTWKMFGANIPNDDLSATVLTSNGTKMSLADFAQNQIKFDSQLKVDEYQQAVKDSKHLVLCGIIDDLVKAKQGNASKVEPTTDPFGMFDMKFQNGYPVFHAVEKKSEEVCINSGDV